MKRHASMNRVYRLIWSQVLNTWVCCAENAKGHGKSISGRKLIAAALALMGGVFLTPLAMAGPVGGQVSAGAGTIAQTGVNTTITQSTQNLAINWQDFSIAANESVRFIQPSTMSVALNRVIGQNPSQILGSLNANGQVFVLNPNGVLFGSSAQVNVGGLVASTLNLSDADLMAGNYSFGTPSPASGRGAVVNQGHLTAAPGGYIALLAPEVRNEGVISATLGTALLAAGDKVTLNLNNGSLLSYSIDQGALQALADNKQLIQADGGRVFMSAKAANTLASAVVNNTGIIQARTIQNVGGVIKLMGDMQVGAVIQTGTLNASGSTGGSIDISGRAILDGGTATVNGTGSTGSPQVGNGGNITYAASTAIVQTSAASLQANGTAAGGTIHLQGNTSLFSSAHLSATGATGGTIDVLGNSVTLAAANLDASGTTQGGLIRVGGDFHGTNASILNAQTTTLNGATKLKANGGHGNVVVWSDQQTDYYGDISANRVGNIEVSSKGLLNYAGTASAGAGGTLLLDPANIVISATGGPAAFALLDPHAAAGNLFGQNVTVLGTRTAPVLTNGIYGAQGAFTPTGKVVIAVPTDSLLAANAGAVYLFDTTTGALISTLTGSTANASIGDGGITVLTNGNYVVSTNFGGGAATWGSGTTGVSGIVSASNSLINVPLNFINPLFNGNYVVVTPNWSNGMIAQAGAVTWGNGNTGVMGVVSASNSLVGTTAGDQVGRYGAAALQNGNYVVSSPFWDNGSVVDAGAVTWGNGTTGIVGAVSASNSLVGSTALDQVGLPGITPLSNGNYLVLSPNWSNGMASKAGAVTWGSGTTGVVGVVSASNSLVGSTAGDQVGIPYFGSGGYVTLLSNGNYVVSSSLWDNGAVVDAGAVTWGSGTTGVVGVVSASNSLVGSTAGDQVGGNPLNSNAAIELSNGNYLVRSPLWDNGAAVDAGAVTWGSGTAGVTGVLSASNSLVGSSTGDRIGNLSSFSGNAGINALSNGNYIVSSPLWDNGAAADAGAVTWGNGTTGVVGVVSASNSLVGSSTLDRVGLNGISVLRNGNYVVGSPFWDNGAVLDAGAATWGNGTTGVVGAVSASNSLVGSSAGDKVGSTYNLGGNIIPLSNGNYVVGTTSWDNGSVVDVGAVTWGNGTTGVVGAVSASNSLVGSSAGDQVGTNSIMGSGRGLYALSNGNYVVSSAFWDNGAVVDAGAVTWGNGTTGVVGTLSANNSLVGTTAGDSVGMSGITALSNGNYVVNSSLWDNGAVVNAGAATWGNGTTGTTGAVSASNSLVGSALDQVGTATIPLSNGNYVVISIGWNNHAGAATWGNGTTGIVGVVSANNSLVGGAAWNQVGANGITQLSNGNYVVNSYLWDNGAVADVGAVTWGSGTTGVKGVVSASNSLVGTTMNDKLGSPGAIDLLNGNYLVRSPNYAGNMGQVLVGSTTGSTAPFTTGNIAFANSAGRTLFVSPSSLTTTLAAGTAVTLQASNDITVNSDILVGGTTGGALSLSAGRSIMLNANINTANGNLNLTANDTAAHGVVNADRAPGAATITMAAGTSINTGTGALDVRLLNGAGNTNNTGGDITLRDITAARINAVNLGGNLNINNSVTGMSLGNVSVTGNLTALSNGALTQAANSYIYVTGNLTALSHGAITQAANNYIYVAGNLIALSNGAITQAASSFINVTGDTTLTADNGIVGAGNVKYGITLTTPNNNFMGAVNATGSSINLLDSVGGLQLGNINATGNLTVLSRGGAITQAVGTGVNVAGTSTLVADNYIGGIKNVKYGITLNNAGNDFRGKVSAVGKNISLTDINALIAAVTDTGNTAYTTGGSLTAWSNTAGNLTTLTTGVGSSTLFGLSHIGGNLSASGSGTISQDASGISVAGTTSLTGSAINLSSSTANDFVGAVSATGTGIALLDGVGGLQLGNINATGNLTALSRGGAITQAVGTGVNVSGASTLIADNTLAGVNNVKYGITLNNASNDFRGKVSAIGNGISLTDKNALIVAVTDTGNTSFTTGGNLNVWSSTTGNLTTTQTAGYTLFGTSNIGGGLVATSPVSVTRVTGNIITVANSPTTTSNPNVTINGQVGALIP
ncbi:MAG: filamentous hemagglutinin N-terminal domain-containing protein [Gallionella sp.]|nr:filamentous hemagglutinin N-terminal domain-containing protein [Gallionella sp.]